MGAGMDRRRFLTSAALLCASAAGSTRLLAQGTSMDGDGYLPVRLPPRPGAAPSMTPDERDALERQIACPCPCTLDIFTCRTSMPCGFSPNLHRDVLALVEGGYSGDEIMHAFTEVYGEHILMAPKREGFNLVGYVAPFAAIGTGAVAILVMLRRWRRDGGDQPMPATVDGVEATDDELARLDAAVRGDGR
jgi:cytochrome c-type biogenesis protein CcmH